MWEKRETERTRSPSTDTSREDTLQVSDIQTSRNVYQDLYLSESETASKQATWPSAHRCLSGCPLLPGEMRRHTH